MLRRIPGTPTPRGAAWGFLRLRSADPTRPRAEWGDLHFAGARAMRVVGLDFGTTHSSIAVYEGSGAPRLASFSQAGWRASQAARSEARPSEGHVAGGGAGTHPRVPLDSALRARPGRSRPAAPGARGPGRDRPLSRDRRRRTPDPIDQVVPGESALRAHGDLRRDLRTRGSGGPPGRRVARGSRGGTRAARLARRGRPPGALRGRLGERRRATRARTAALRARARRLRGGRVRAGTGRGRASLRAADHRARAAS